MPASPLKYHFLSIFAKAFRSEKCHAGCRAVLGRTLAVDIATLARNHQTSLIGKRCIIVEPLEILAIRMFGYKLIGGKASVESRKWRSFVLTMKVAATGGRQGSLPFDVCPSGLPSLPTSTATAFAYDLGTQYSELVKLRLFIYSEQDMITTQKIGQPANNPVRISRLTIGSQLSILQILTGLGSHGENQRLSAAGP
ncbi:hypothetical protein BDW68DRAFT_116250 [Aspergillus falconensis]